MIAVKVLLKVRPARKIMVAVAHWLINNPAVAMTQAGLREMIRNELTPLRVEVRDLASDVSGLRRESVAQYETVSDQLGDLQATVDGHGRRLERVETALMNGWRRGER